MYNIILIEKLLVFSLVCLFVMNNAKSVTGDTDFSFTYDLIKGIVKSELKGLAEEFRADIKRIEQQISDLKAVNVEATTVENNDVTAEPFSTSDNQQLDKLSTVIYRTLSEEKQLMRKTIVGLEDRISEFEKSFTDNYQLMSNNISDIRRLVTKSGEQNNVNGVQVNQLNRSMEEERKESVRKTRELENNILRLQTYVGSSFKTIQADICIIPTVDDRMTVHTLHDGTQLAASSEVSSDIQIILDCGKTNFEPSNRTVRCERGQWTYQSPRAWTNATKDEFPKCSEVYCTPSDNVVERSGKNHYKHGETFDCGTDYRLAEDSVCNNGNWTSEPECVSTLTSCATGEFDCGNGRCILGNWKCDGDNDCGNYADEDNCTLNSCGTGVFSCGNETCISITWICDGINDCPNHADEANCWSFKVETGASTQHWEQRPAAHLMGFPHKFEIPYTADLSIAIPEWVSNTDLAFTENVKYRHGRIVISEAGLYYVYSQLSFLERFETQTAVSERPHTLSHYIYRYNIIYPIGGEEEMVQSSFTKCSGEDKNVGEYTSYLRSVFSLRQGDEVFVKASYLTLLVWEPTQNYFGLFKVN